MPAPTSTRPAYHCVECLNLPSQASSSCLSKWLPPRQLSQTRSRFGTPLSQCHIPTRVPTCVACVESPQHAPASECALPRQAGLDEPLAGVTRSMSPPQKKQEQIGLLQVQLTGACDVSCVAGIASSLVLAVCRFCATGDTSARSSAQQEAGSCSTSPSTVAHHLHTSLTLQCTACAQTHMHTCARLVLTTMPQYPTRLSVCALRWP